MPDQVMRRLSGWAKFWIAIATLIALGCLGFGILAEFIERIEMGDEGRSPGSIAIGAVVVGILVGAIVFAAAIVAREAFFRLFGRAVRTDTNPDE